MHQYDKRKATPSRVRIGTWQVGAPPRPGPYLVYAPSTEPGQPFVVITVWDEDDGWSMLPEEWSTAISHWMPLPAPPPDPRSLLIALG